MELFILIAFGAIGGFISGLLGVGGGIIYVPVLTSVLALYGIDDPELAKFILANSFAATFFAGAISSYKQFKLNSFFPRQIFLTALIAIPSSLGISYLITQGTWYNKQSFSIFFIFILLLMLLRFLTSKKSDVALEENPENYKFSITGALTGIVSALSGLGGGVIMVPLFTQFVKIDIKKAASISIGVIPVMMVPMILYYGGQHPSYVHSSYQIGYLLPTIFGPLIAGLLFAAPIGVSVGKKASPKFLKIIFASLIVVVIIKTLLNLV
ncbi:MAG: sulfite exporter TauE/SafE family protein [Bacteroidia bacterium]